MNTTIRPYTEETPDGFPAGLPAREYKIKSALSGQAYGPYIKQSPYIEGMWAHAHWTAVMSRVKNHARLARDMASGPITVQTTMLPGGSYKRSWIFKDRWGYEQSLHLWITPTES